MDGATQITQYMTFYKTRGFPTAESCNQFKRTSHRPLNAELIRIDQNRKYGSAYEPSWTDTPTCLMTTARKPHGLRGTPLTRPRAFSRTSLKDTVASSLSSPCDDRLSTKMYKVQIEHWTHEGTNCRTSKQSKLQPARVVRCHES